MVRRIVWAASLLLACGCSNLADTDVSGLACATGDDCLEGYACNPSIKKCVAELPVGCGGDAVCPSQTHTGDACETEGAFVPCFDGVSDCILGCRTCDASTWSACVGCDQCVTYYRDDDGDGVGVASDSVCTCVPEVPYATETSGDCDDSAATCSAVCDDVDGDSLFDCRDDCVDVDGDGVGTGSLGNAGCATTMDDSDDANANVCGDSESDGCEDCQGGTFAAADDGLDFDGDLLCDSGDPDDDNDGVGDGSDPAPMDPDVCGDSDSDSCDDCARGTDDLGAQPDVDAGNDGLDTDGDGLCDAGDPDDDNDGFGDGSDPADLDPTICGADVDGDNCDDCTTGQDGFGPLPDNLPADDGLDTDGDGTCDGPCCGICDGGCAEPCSGADTDDDDDGVLDVDDIDSRDPTVCEDSDDDTCDDCSVSTSGPNPNNDGVDQDTDGLCNDGDTDDDNDGVEDSLDWGPLNPYACRDEDGDSCDDCAIGTDQYGVLSDATPANDGTDTDTDGFCDPGDCGPTNGNVNPSVREGPRGDATCTDGLDNDCDGSDDNADDGCWWWDGEGDDNWTRRQKLRFDNTGNADALADFPALIVLDATEVDYTMIRPDGFDLRFIAADRTTVLPYEVQIWSWSDTSYVWVKVPAIGANTANDHVWLYYGYAGQTTSGENPAVWSDYAGVWHLDEDPAGTEPQIGDSTANANNGSSRGTMDAADSLPGIVGNALDFDGSDDYIEVPTSSSLEIATAEVTLSCWVRMSASQSNDAGVLVKSGPSQYNMQLGVQGSDAGNFRLYTGSETYLSGGTTLEIDRWYLLHGVYDGAEARVYLDGLLDGTDANSGNIVPSTQSLVIGRRDPGDDRFFIGAVDECRIVPLARSDGWMRAQMKTALDDNFVIIGPVENR